MNTKNDNVVGVYPVAMAGTVITCQATCPHSSHCVNHSSANGFRRAGGDRPSLAVQVTTDGIAHVTCTREIATWGPAYTLKELMDMQPQEEQSNNELLYVIRAFSPETQRVQYIALNSVGTMWVDTLADSWMYSKYECGHRTFNETVKVVDRMTVGSREGVFGTGRTQIDLIELTVNDRSFVQLGETAGYGRRLGDINISGKVIASTTIGT